MIIKNNNRYAKSQGIKLLMLATQKLGPIFTIKDIDSIAKELNIPRPQLRILISLLAKSGWIEILKNGTYAVKSPLFENEISPFALASSLIQPSAISHWSAMAHHGLTTQVPTIVQASTTRNVITPEMRNGHANRPRGRAVWRVMDIEVEFIHVQSRHFFGFQKIWVNTWQQVLITDPERTALDLIARSDVFGGMSSAFDLLEEILPRLDVKALVQYGMQYDTGALIKRLGWILENMGISEEITAPLRNYKVKTYYRLDPHKPSNHKYSPLWKIIENIW